MVWGLPPHASALPASGRMITCHHVCAGAMTSGEVTHRFLHDRPDDSWKAIGTKCLHFTWGSRGAVDISSVGLSVVTEPSECEFILAHGTEGLGLPDGDVQPSCKADMEALLDRCAELGDRPMVIANPDIVTVSGCAFFIATK